VRPIPGGLFFLTTRYHLRVLRREQLAMPAGLWVLFVLMVWLFRHEAGRSYKVASGFLGVVLPLVAGVLAAPVLVDDPAVELQLAAPRPPWHTLVERLLVLLAIAGLAAVSFQGVTAGLGVPLDQLGGPMACQLVWLTPSVALMGLASFSTLCLKHSLTGALLVGLAWIIQLFYRNALSGSPWTRYVYLFMGAAQPGHPELAWNQTALVSLSILLLAACALVLRREERLL